MRGGGRAAPPEDKENAQARTGTRSSPRSPVLRAKGVRGPFADLASPNNVSDCPRRRPAKEARQPAAAYTPYNCTRCAELVPHLEPQNALSTVW